MRCVFDKDSGFDQLRNYYCALRIYKRNQSRRRFYYRRISKECLRLVEAGACAECVRVYCRYLAAGKIWKDIKPCYLCTALHVQLVFDFSS